ncbi:MAG TPA: Ig-like domain-containing protein [Edaphocola sp.]|nr:Ig-like domain-containing protein [Edaphocola sp.]
MRFKHDIIQISFIAWLLIILSSCANIVPPSGGEPDLTPPILLNQQPKDSLLNQKVLKIILKFNKFVVINDLAKNMTLSPMIDPMPEVIAKGKTVEIKFVDSLLKPNTTYSLSLGNAITDNRERTPYKDFKYTFSTGSYFDSLELKGNVRDALTNANDTGILVALYPSEFNDSLLNLKKPMYITMLDASGNFHFSSLPAGKFKLYAFDDNDGNRLFNQEAEKIGFLDNLVEGKPKSDTNALFLKIRTSLMAKRVIPTKIDMDSNQQNKQQFIGRVSSAAKEAKMYLVMVDTSNIENGSFDLKDSINIKLNAVLKNLDTPKVFLSYLNQNGIESQSNMSLSHDSVSLFVKDVWMPETHYILRLVKGWAVDTNGVELPPGKYEFRTKSLKDYSKLSVSIPDSFVKNHNILVIRMDKDTIFHKPILEKVYHLDLLNPGNYQITIIADKNENGKWDPGDLFKKIQPEEIFHNEQDAILKSGWDHEVDFIYKPQQTIKETDKKKSQRMGGIQ